MIRFDCCLSHLLTASLLHRIASVGPVRQLLRELARLGHHLLGRDRVVHHPDAAGLGAGDEIAAHQEFLGAMRPDQQRPNNRAAVAGDNADFDVSVGKARLLRYHRNIAEQRKRRAEADRVAVDGADDGLLDVEKIIHQAAPVGRRDRTASSPLALAIAGSREVAARHALDVAASAERASRAGQDDRIDVAIGAHVDPDLLELVMHDVVDGVERVRPINRDRRDAVRHFDFEEFVIAVVGRHDQDLPVLLPERYSR